MSFREFWKSNKYGYMWSCITITLLSLFLGLIKKFDMTATSLFILASLPVMFLIAFGIYEFTGGDKE